MGPAVHRLEEGRHPTSLLQEGGGWGFPKAIHCTWGLHNCCTWLHSFGGERWCGDLPSYGSWVMRGKSGGKTCIPTSSSPPASWGGGINVCHHSIPWGLPLPQGCCFLPSQHQAGRCSWVLTLPTQLPAW